MLMVCPNCSSTDIITVQDQRFCISCGQILAVTSPGPTVATKPATTAKPAASAAAGSTVTASKPVSAKPRSSAQSKIDLPQPAPISVTANPRTTSDIVKPVTATAPRIGQPASQQPQATSTPKPKTKTSPTNKPASKSIHPAPAHSAPAHPKPAHLAATHSGVGRSVGAHPAPLPYGAIEGGSLRERLQPKTALWAICPAVLLALVTGVLTYMLVGAQAGQALETIQHAGWPIWGELILVLLLFYVSRSVGNAAIIYGASRRADHRPLSGVHQLSASLNSFPSRLGFDIMMTVFQISVVALIATLVIIGGAPWPVPEFVQTIALFVAYLMLGYLLVGLALAQGLGHIALTLGKLSVWQSFKLGWDFFRRHFDMIGFKCFSLILECILALPLFAAIVALALYLPTDMRWLAAVTAVILTTIGGALLGAGTAIWWQAAYRVLVHRSRSQEAAKLLSGRQPQPIRPAAAVFTAGTVTILAGLATVWSWLPWG